MSLLNQTLGLDLSGRDHAPHHPRGPQDSRERAGVDVADRDDLVSGQVVTECPARPPVAGNRRRLPHDEPSHLRGPRLAVVSGDAIVADLGTGHRDDLPGVGRSP